MAVILANGVVTDASAFLAFDEFVRRLEQHASAEAGCSESSDTPPGGVGRVRCPVGQSVVLASLDAALLTDLLDSGKGPSPLPFIY